MDILKHKWKNYTVQKKLHDQWEDYTKSKDDLQKFKIFLQQANESCKEFTGSSDFKLEELLGDVSAVLDAILEYLNQYSSIQNKSSTPEQVQLIQEVFELCLQLTEYILQDPKYRRKVENSHNVLTEFLNLMDKAQRNEQKVIIVKLLVLFSETINQRIEFFEQQGFNRLLQIVMTRDPQLSKVISKALLHFLSIEGIQYVDLTADCAQTPSIKSKISKIAVDFRKFAFKELQKVFLQEKVQHQQIKEVQQVQDHSVKKILESPLTYQDIFEADLSLYLQSSRSTSEGQEEDKIIEESPPDEIMKEFQMLQGGFKAILEMLLKASDEVQLDLMKTIIKILGRSDKNKAEFKKIHGYEVLNQMFSQTEQSKLEELFQFLMEMIFENSLEYQIKDHDAFQLLLELVAFQDNEQIISQGFQILELVLTSNWKNIFIAKRQKMNFYLFILHMRFFLNNQELEQLIQQCQNEYMASSFKQILKKTNFNLLKDEMILQKIQNLFFKIASIEGLYNLETETFYSEFALQDKLEAHFQATLFGLIKIKISKPWTRLHSFDHLAEAFLKNLSLLYTQLYGKLFSNQNTIRCFLELQGFINQFMTSVNIQDSSSNQQHLIQNIVSQNRWEQFNSLLQVHITGSLIENKDGLKQLLEILEFEQQKQDDLATQILKYRLNDVVIEGLGLLLQKNDAFFNKFHQEHGPELLLYIAISQYQLFDTLKQNSQIESPVYDLAKNLFMGVANDPRKSQDYLPVLITFLTKFEMTDKCFTLWENLNIQVIRTLKQQDLSIIVVKILNSLPKTITHLNLYASQLQFIELLLYNLQQEELETFLDMTLNYENYKRLQEPQFSNGLSDVLSIISIQCMIQNANGPLSDRIFSDYITNIIGLLEVPNLNVRQQAFKVVATFYLMNQKYKKISTLTQKNKILQLIQKLMVDKIPYNNQICNTIYKYLFWQLDSFHILFPENTSQVSSVMTRGQAAEIILKTQKQHLENQQAEKIFNPDFIEIFIISLTRNPSETYRQEVLKVFLSILDSFNIQVLLDMPNFIQVFTPLCEFQVEREVCHKIITKVIVQDFQRKQPKSVELLKKISDQVLVESLIKYILQQVIDNPIFRGDQQNFLKNLQILIQSLDELVGYNEQISVQVLQTINILASKNSPQVRSVLKSLNFFEIRDQLVFQILRYNLDPETLTQVLSGISFNQFCQQRQFKETHTMAYLIRKLLRNQNHFGLQMLIIKILKYDIAQSEENQKYVAKMLVKDEFVGFFYPNLLKKLNKTFKCLQSKQNEDHQGENEDAKEFETDQYVQQLGPNSTLEDFLRVFYSPQYEDDRKQIELNLDKVLLIVESDFQKHQVKLNSKKQALLQKLNESQQAEQLQIQQAINDWELKIQKSLKKTSEKFKQKILRTNDLIQNKLEVGETSFFRIVKIVE